MSLKAFHILFICVSILLALGFGAWEIRAFAQAGATSDILLGVFSWAAGVALSFYLRRVIKKLKNISSL